MNRLSLLVLAVLHCLCLVYAQDRKAFHTSRDTEYYKRIEGIVQGRPYKWSSLMEEVVIDEDQAMLRVPVHSGAFSDVPSLLLTIQMLQNGVVRVKVVEHESILQKHGARWSSAPYTTVGGLEPAKKVLVSRKKEEISACMYDKYQAEICMHQQPLNVQVSVSVDGIPVVQLNKQQLLHMEQRPFLLKPTTSTFNGHIEQQPRGNMATSIDITFPQHEYIYGLAEHASSHALKRTKQNTNKRISSLASQHANTLLSIPEQNKDLGEISLHPENRIFPNKLGQWGEEAYNEPYRLFNTDVFRYEIDEPTSLYGSVPYVNTHTSVVNNVSVSVGVYYINSAEGFVNIVGDNFVESQWIFETSDIDMVILPSTHTQGVRVKYADITGYSQLAPLWTLGKHQCRWNYMTQEDLLSVDDQLKQHDVPYDTIWLDIEHTDGKKYFTWDKKAFSNYKGMIQSLNDTGRNLVMIIDPHVKADPNYPVYLDLKKMNGVIRTESLDVYQGKCWPGMSVYADFLQTQVQTYWAEKTAEHMYGANMHVWNDMNEPSVFEGPEGSAPRHQMHCDENVKNCLEHRELHNLYGMLYHQSTYNGLQSRTNERPFVLTRAFHAGTQRTAFVWTGDNAAGWSHIRAATPMLLSLGSVNIPYVGSDMGGFFDNCDGEMLARWYQAALLHPFYRNHANIETKRREPYLFPQYLPSIKQSVKLRYSLLQHLYTATRVSNITGNPILSSFTDTFPADVNARVEDNAYIVQGIVVVPVYKPRATMAYAYSPFYNNISYPIVHRVSGELFTRLTHSPTFTIASTFLTPSIGILAGMAVVSNETPKRNAPSTVKTPITISLAPLPSTLVTSTPDHTFLYTLYGLDAMQIKTPVYAHGKVYRDDYKTHAFLDGIYTYTHILQFATKVILTTPLHDEYTQYIPTSCHASSLATPMCTTETKQAYSKNKHANISLETHINKPYLSNTQDVPSINSLRLLWAATDLQTPTSIAVYIKYDGLMTEAWCDQAIAQNQPTQTYPVQTDLFVSAEYTQNQALRVKLPATLKLTQEICIGFLYK